MPSITITLTDLEDAALGHIARDQYDYLENLVTWQARVATEEIVEIELERMRNDPNITHMPANITTILSQMTMGTAAERAALGEE
jgi:hypothetical protein